ncbi:MAG: tol-pal system YbgF family protein [Kofleriaceae bacterium]
MMRSTLLMCAALLAVAPSARAQPAPDGGAAPAADRKAEAKAHYEKGQNHYNLGEFDQAISEFKAAYNLSSAPGLLFNIAQSYRLKKDYEQASYFYKTFLRLKPDAKNRPDVEARIAEMDKLLADQKAMASSPPTGTVPPDGETKPAESDKPEDTKPDDQRSAAGSSDAPIVVERRADGSGKSLMTAGLATAGAGAALIVTGVVFGKMAKSASDELDALDENMGTWTQAEQDKYDAGKRNNTIALISFIAGGAAVATGATLWVMGKLKDGSSSVAIVPTNNGATFAYGWQF